MGINVRLRRSYFVLETENVAKARNRKSILPFVIELRTIKQLFNPHFIFAKFISMLTSSFKRKVLDQI
jgi:hypothetical protein